MQVERSEYRNVAGHLEVPHAPPCACVCWPRVSPWRSPRSVSRRSPRPRQGQSWLGVTTKWAGTTRPATSVALIAAAGPASVTQRGVGVWWYADDPAPC